MVLLRARDEPVDYGSALGWEQLITGSLRVIDVPGDHNSVMYPHAEHRFTLPVTPEEALNLLSDPVGDPEWCWRGRSATPGRYDYAGRRTQPPTFTGASTWTRRLLRHRAALPP
jgi:hypothetical protein